MRKFWKMAGAMALITLFGAPAWALYRFDDLYGPSGVGAQWMVITGGWDTLGNATTQPLDASGDIVSDRYSVEVWNGRSSVALDQWSNRDIHTMFLVLPESRGNLTVNFTSTAHDHRVLPDSITPDAITPDVGVDSRNYYVQKTSNGSPTGNSPSLLDSYSYTDFWKQYVLQLVKNGNEKKYESVRGNFLFHQNPSTQYPSTPSQTLQVPLVIANVYNGTARDEPLLLRTTLRNENNAYGDIVACDRFEWSVVNDMVAGESQWVFVPVDAWPIDTQRIYYRLTTAVTNHTAIRYAVQRYDNYNWPYLNPSYWKFDLAPTPDLGDLANPFQLDELSHIAPGLVTFYNQRYDINQGEKRALRLYPVDPMTGFRELTLNHRILFGINLGDVKGTSSGNTSNRNAAPYRVTAFNPRTANTPASFLEALARQMNAYEPDLSLRQIVIPETTGFLSTGHVTYEYVAGDIINSFAVKRSIPASMRTTGTEGLLPLHITFNLPKTHLYVSRYWDELLRQWHETGDIHDLFAQNFSVYLLSRKEGEQDNPWDMVQQMLLQDAYRDQVKIFMDEDRGVITVSFIVMLMDGTRDGTRPALYLVRDQTATTSNTFMVVRDGWFDNDWNLTFYAAPAGYSHNDENLISRDLIVSPDTIPQPTPSDQSNKDESGGGGCDILSIFGLAMFCAVPLTSRRKG